MQDIRVVVRRSAGGELTARFRLDGDLTRLVLPSPRPPRMATALWQHTCFEVFVAIAGEGAYHELNFSPSGEWAAYGFRSYREGACPASETQAPRIVLRTGDDWLEIDGSIRLKDLSAVHPQAPLRLGLSAVVEARGGQLSYWALRHPRAKPDFHHADAFALRLEASRPRC